MLKDSYERIHNYLRISLTDKCNLRCAYCNPVDLPKGYFAGATRMTSDEIDRIVSVFVGSGVNKIRLTGGEPLVRKDAKEIIQRLSKHPVELAITTNGVFIHEYIDTFREAGIHSVNVSLDSLTKEGYSQITQRNEYDRVRRNIELLISHAFHVKINVVVVKDLNDHEIIDFVEWTKCKPLHVRFIEFMPFAGNQWKGEKVINHAEILKLISTKYQYVRVPGEMSDTAKKYFVPGHQGTFAVISTMSEPFCNGCNRMRLTADGKMKNCLFSQSEVDLLTALRNGEDILPLIQDCIAGKAERMGGQFAPLYEDTDVSGLVNRCMIAIGG